MTIEKLKQWLLNEINTVQEKMTFYNKYSIEYSRLEDKINTYKEIVGKLEE